jgi:hypothetical protein
MVLSFCTIFLLLRKYTRPYAKPAYIVFMERIYSMVTTEMVEKNINTTYEARAI